MRMSGARTRVVLWVLIFVASLTSVVPFATVSALQLTARSVTLGTSAPSTSSSYSFAFTAASTANIGSIRFQFCTTAAGTCNAVTGLTTTSATLTSVSAGFTASGWSIQNGTAGSPYINRGAAVSIPATTAGTVVLDTITNPSTANQTYYIRITTYTGTDGATGATDTGTVAASTALPIELEGTMPEYLRFCTAATIGVDGNGAADCSTATDGSVVFSQLFDPSSTATATSQMAASSNAGSGYVITYYGETLESGANSIPAMPTGASTTSIGQFGLNLKDNTTPDVGLEVDDAGISGQVYNGVAVAPYATADQFTFVANTATTVANSANTVSDLQLYTVSYIVNVPGSQAAGTYTTTLTYVCTATY